MFTYIKHYVLSDVESNTITLGKSNSYFIQEVLVLKCLSEWVFVQRLTSYEGCNMSFEYIDLPDISYLTYDSDIKFICYSVIKFILKSHEILRLNHNDLSIRNIMFNDKCKYKFTEYDGYELPKYVPVIIDFEFSQVFEYNILLSDVLLNEHFNIMHTFNPVYVDIYKFLSSLIEAIDNKIVRLHNLDFAKRVYNKIFIHENVVCKQRCVIDIKCLDNCVKDEIKGMSKYEDTLKYLFN